MFPEYIGPEHTGEFTFESGINISFGDGSMIDFYNEEDDLILRMDPEEISIIYSSYRAMVRERLEEQMWSGRGD